MNPIFLEIGLDAVRFIVQELLDKHTPAGCEKPQIKEMGLASAIINHLVENNART